MGGVAGLVIFVKLMLESLIQFVWEKIVATIAGGRLSGRFVAESGVQNLFDFLFSLLAPGFFADPIFFSY